MFPNRILVCPFLMRKARSSVLPIVALHREVGMSRITSAWTWLRLQIRELRPQLRLCLRVTVAAMLSFVLGKSLNIPLGGL